MPIGYQKIGLSGGGNQDIRVSDLESFTFHVT